MINDIRAKADEMVQAAIQQSERMQNELNAAVDLLAAGQVAFNGEMLAVAKLRAEAERRQAAAVRAFDTVCTQFTAIIVGLNTQIKAGSIVTGGGALEQGDVQLPANDDTATAQPTLPVTGGVAQDAAQASAAA